MNIASRTAAGVFASCFLSLAAAFSAGADDGSRKADPSAEHKMATCTIDRISSSLFEALEARKSEFAAIPAAQLDRMEEDVNASPMAFHYFLNTLYMDYIPQSTMKALITDCLTEATGITPQTEEEQIRLLENTFQSAAFDEVMSVKAKELVTKVFSFVRAANAAPQAPAPGLE